MPLRWALLGALLGLLAGLVAFAPAAWLAQAASSATDGQVQLADARGTVWQGSASLVLTAGPGSSEASILPGRLRWSLAPRWNGLVLQLGADCCATQPLLLRVAASWDSVRLDLSDTPSRWPAAVLVGLGAPWNTIRAQGDIELLPQGLSVEWAGGLARVRGRLQVDAWGMSSRLSTMRPLGSYRLHLEGQAGTQAPQLRLETLAGALALQGAGQWTATGWRFQGEASAAAPESEAALSNLLNIVGRRQGAKSIITLG